MKRKLLIIGLDGASFTVLNPLIRQGVMPTLARLKRTGFSTTLLSSLPPVSAPAWASFMTGKNPGKHGVFQFYDINPWSPESLGRGQRTYMAVPGVVVNSHSIAAPKIWDLLDAAGLRSATINLPMTYPPTPINGLMITGMLTPPGSGQFTYPPELAQSLQDYEIDLNPKEKDFSSSDEEFLGRMRDILKKRTRTALDLFRQEQWDCFIVVFTETDRLQHRYWRVLDPSCEESATEEITSGIIDLYRHIDEVLAVFSRLAGDEYDIIILSDHGFGPSAHRRLSLSALGRWLDLEVRQNGYLSWTLRRLRNLAPSKQRIYKYLGSLLPESTLKRCEDHLRAMALQGVKAKLIKLHDYIGGVWINTTDRPQGIIEPGDAYFNFRTEIVQKLAALYDPLTNRRVVSEIMLREGLYRGAHILQAPDIIFALHEEYGIDTTSHTKDLLRQAPQANQGTHRAEGILIMSGKAVRPMRRAWSSQPAPTPHRIEDVTATMLYLAGVPLLDDMDGGVIKAAIDETYLQDHPISFQSAATLSGRESADRWASPDDEEIVRQRLRELGYLD